MRKHPTGEILKLSDSFPDLHAVRQRGAGGPWTWQSCHLMPLAVSGLKEQPQGTLTQNAVFHKKLGMGLGVPGRLTLPSAWTPTSGNPQSNRSCTFQELRACPLAGEGFGRTGNSIPRPVCGHQVVGSSQGWTPTNSEEMGCQSRGCQSRDICRGRDREETSGCRKSLSSWSPGLRYVPG